MNRKMPEFICVGAQKAATTSFDAMIRQHPDVFMPEKKELHYFDADDYKANEGEYAIFFEKGCDSKIRGEVTPAYLYYEEVPKRIYELLGENVKIIIMLREPIARALSQYKMTCRQLYLSGAVEPLTFEEAFYKGKDRILRDSFSRRSYSYFDRGLYSKQVKRYLELFKNVKIILFEDFVMNNSAIMKEIYDFLEVDYCQIELEKSNEGRGTGGKYRSILKLKRIIGYQLKKITFINNSVFFKNINKKIVKSCANDDKDKYKISNEFYWTLREFYEQDICELEVLINRDLSSWRK